VAVARQHDTRADPVFDPGTIELLPSRGEYVEIARAEISAPLGPTFALGPMSKQLSAAYARDIEVMAVGCYLLDNVGVTSQGFVVRERRLLISRQLHVDQSSFVRARSFGRLLHDEDAKRRLNATAVLLTGPGHRGYGHWLVDFLPKLFVVKAAGIDPLAVSYVVPGDVPEFALRWLHLVGISEDLIERYDPYAEIVEVANLIVPTPMRTGGRAHPLLRDAAAYLGDLLNRRQGPDRPDRGPDRIFLSRPNVPGLDRMLVNRAGIERIAEAAGYTIVHPERLPITDQVAIFRGASHVAGEYGSAMHGTIFARADVSVCALRPDTLHPGFLQSGLCQVMGQTIGYVFGVGWVEGAQTRLSIADEDWQLALQMLEVRDAGARPGSRRWQHARNLAPTPIARVRMLYRRGRLRLRQTVTRLLAAGVFRSPSDAARDRS